MKKKRLFRYFVFFVIALFFLSIPWMYVSYFLLSLQWDSKKGQSNLYQNPNLGNTEKKVEASEEEFFSKLKREVETETWTKMWTGDNILSWNILTWATR